MLLNEKSDLKSEVENRIAGSGRITRKMPDGFNLGSL